VTTAEVCRFIADHKDRLRANAHLLEQEVVLCPGSFKVTKAKPSSPESGAVRQTPWARGVAMKSPNR